jgi:hypothetical protein
MGIFDEGNNSTMMLLILIPLLMKANAVVE